MSTTRPRRFALAALGLVLAAIATLLIVGDRSVVRASPAPPATRATSFATVTEQPLSSQTQVNATLAYAAAANIRIPTGTPPSAVRQAEQVVSSSEHMLARAWASLPAIRAARLSPANALRTV